MLKIILLLVIIMGCSAFAYEDVSEQAKTFLEKNTTEKNRTKWRAKLIDPDASIKGDMYGQDKVLDIFKIWLGRFKNRFNKKDKKPNNQLLLKDEKIELCEWYLLFKEKNWPMPEVEPYSKIDEYITVANFKAWIDDTVSKAEDDKHEAKLDENSKVHPN